MLGSPGSGRGCGAGFWPYVGSGTAAKLATLLSISCVEGALRAYAPLKEEADGGETNSPPPPSGLSEQAEQDGRRLVGDRERLNAQLLLGLQRLEVRAFLRQVGVHEVADARVDRVLQALDERQVRREGLVAGAQLAEGRGGARDRRVQGR